MNLLLSSVGKIIWGRVIQFYGMIYILLNEMFLILIVYYSILFFLWIIIYLFRRIFCILLYSSNNPWDIYNLHLTIQTINPHN